MSVSGPLDPATVRRTVVSVGADRPRLHQDLARHSDEIDAQLAQNGLQAFSLGPQSTPALLIGRYLMKGRLGDLQLQTRLAQATRASPGR